MARLQLSTLIHSEGDAFVAVCPEAGVASQGRSAEEARANLQEALALFFADTAADEIERLLRSGPSACPTC